MCTTVMSPIRSPRRVHGSLPAPPQFSGYYNFNWLKDFNLNDSKDKQILNINAGFDETSFIIKNFFIAFTVFLMGLLCLTSSTELIETNLGKKISLGLGIFWTVRLFIQFFGYPKDLWKGKKLETSIYILFSIFWIYFSSIFLINYYT